MAHQHRVVARRVAVVGVPVGVNDLVVGPAGVVAVVDGAEVLPGGSVLQAGAVGGADVVVGPLAAFGRQFDFCSPPFPVFSMSAAKASISSPETTAVSTSSTPPLLGAVLAETAISQGLPVLTSETHGMAQRGGVVISHFKAGAFASPLVRPGKADLLLLLKGENLAIHRHFLKPGGTVIMNAREVPADHGDQEILAVDADGLALKVGNPQAVNLILLGFALTIRGRERLFCTGHDIVGVMERKLTEKGKLLAASLRALEVGMEEGRGRRC